MDMKYRRLGESGLEVSALCVGTMMFGDRTDANEARRIVDDARAAGINFIDTADVYANGRSEEIVGAAIGAHRRSWILATKVGNPMTKKPHDGGLSRRLGALRESLVEVQALLGYEIDFPGEDDGPVPPARIAAALQDVSERIERLIVTAPSGERLREGALLVLAGRPNAGKSSLFNALLGAERAPKEERR